MVLGQTDMSTPDGNKNKCTQGPYRAVHSTRGTSVADPDPGSGAFLTPGS
jgi:hypothetical protein